MSFSSSAWERPLCVVGAPGASLGAFDVRDALEVGRVDCVFVEVPDEEVGRGVQRRLYMHSAGWCQRRPIAMRGDVNLLWRSNM